MVSLFVFSFHRSIVVNNYLLNFPPLILQRAFFQPLLFLLADRSLTKCYTCLTVLYLIGWFQCLSLDNSGWSPSCQIHHIFLLYFLLKHWKIVKKNWPAKVSIISFNCNFKLWSFTVISCSSNCGIGSGLCYIRWLVQRECLSRYWLTAQDRRARPRSEDQRNQHRREHAWKRRPCKYWLQGVVYSEILDLFPRGRKWALPFWPSATGFPKNFCRY